MPVPNNYSPLTPKEGKVGWFRDIGDGLEYSKDDGITYLKADGSSKHPVASTILFEDKETLQEKFDQGKLGGGEIEVIRIV